MPGPAQTPQLLAHRFFFALKPDDVTARRTRMFAEQRFGEKGLLRWEHLHMTLALTEDFDAPFAAVTDALLRAGESIAAAPFALALGQLSSSGRSIALRPEHVAAPLRDLQRQVAGAMAREGVALRADSRFSPHVTLGYRAGPPDSRPVPPFHWQLSEFVLVHSFVGLTRHEIIGRWALRPADAAQLSLL